MGTTTAATAGSIRRQFNRPPPSGRPNQTAKNGTTVMDRRSILRLAGLGLGTAVGMRGIETAAAQSASAVPAGPVQYRVQLTGQTNRGGFTRPGDLYVFPALETSGANFNNGINARDIGLFSGNPSASPETGAIWFATNTGVYDRVGLRTITGDALIDVAVVEANEEAGLIDLTLDPNAARTVQLNLMNARGGLTANVYQLLEGTMQLQFTDSGRGVRGEIQFVGNGFIEPGRSPYQAALDGVLVE